MALAHATQTGSRLYPVSIAPASPTTAEIFPYSSGTSYSSEKNRPAFSGSKRQCVAINPNTLFQTYTHIGYGKDFKVFEPLVPGQKLNLWQKLLLAPIQLYQNLTRHNTGASGKFFRGVAQSNGCPFPKSHADRKASCSEYTALAIKFFGQSGLIGTIKGGFVGLSRIAHCNPWVRKKAVNGQYSDPQWKVCLPKSKAANWAKADEKLSVTA